MRYALLLVAVCVGAAEPPKTWTPEHSMKVRNVGDVTVSPDGKRVAWTQTLAVMEGEKSESVTQIFMAATDGTGLRQVTRGEKSSNSPAFAPDNRFLYFSSTRAGSPKIFRLPLEGGEAEMVFEMKGTIGEFRLSPDGKFIGFLGREADTAGDKATKEKTDWKVIDEGPANQTLWVVSTDPASQKAPRRVVSMGYHIASLDWSPDSRRIVYQHLERPDFDVARFSDISEVEVETGKVTVLAATVATESQPKYSPDGRYVAFVRSQGPGSVLVGNRIALMTRADGKTRDLAATFDESPQIVDWSGDSRYIYCSEARRTRQVLYAMPVDGSPQEVLAPDKGTLGPVKLNDTGTHFGFARQTMDEPPEAYVAPVTGKGMVRVSHANVDLAKPPLGESRVVRWKAKDGLEIEGLLTLPVEYQSGKKVPMVLVIHGGPSGVFGEQFIGAPGLYPVAGFASKGWATLRCNIRGSSAYGRKFRAANFQDWGGKDYEDLMAGVDYAVAQGIADPDKLAVMGWSYGGYMTSWVVTQTQRFKAAAVGAGITNLVSMWGTNDIPSVLNDYFGGPYWQQWDGYVKRSAMAHVSNVTTPTLILHGEKDNRVPTDQGYEFYQALKRKGVKTQMVVYPRTQHGPQEPKFVQDIMQRHIAWVEQAFQPVAATAP